MTANTYGFSGLTKAQRELLTFNGWQGCQFPPTQPQARTVRRLLDRGLLIEHKRPVSSPFGTMVVSEYEVPLRVHVAWCAHCAGHCETLP